MLNLAAIIVREVHALPEREQKVVKHYDRGIVVEHL